MSATRARGSHAPGFIACLMVGSSSPIDSHVMPGRHSAWRGRFGFDVSRKISPLTFRYEPVRPSCRQSPCLPSVRYSAPRYFSHSSGGSTTCESPSNTAKSLVFIAPSARGEKLSARDGRLRPERRAHLLVGRPPLGSLDLAHALADDVAGCRHAIEPSRIGAEELHLMLHWQPVLLHGLDGAPRVV